MIKDELLITIALLEQQLLKTKEHVNKLKTKCEQQREHYHTEKQRLQQLLQSWVSKCNEQPVIQLHNHTISSNITEEVFIVKGMPSDLNIFFAMEYVMKQLPAPSAKGTFKSLHAYNHKKGTTWFLKTIRPTSKTIAMQFFTNNLDVSSNELEDTNCNN